MKTLTETEWLQNLKSAKNPARSGYKAMYSTWWHGIVTDPALMVVPVDDHQVHRGDAVFEAMKCVNGCVYLANEHLDRLDRSAASLSLKNPLNRSQMLEVLEKTLQASGLKNALFRLFLSRGPGQFSTNPYDSVGPQVSLVVTELRSIPAEKIENGVSVGISKIPVKDPWLAQIKSCNYLPNVLMKKEAVDRGLDFTIGVGPHGDLTEGSTENFFLVDDSGVLVRPRLAGILSGTTMMRAFELAPSLIAEGLLASITERDLHLEDLSRAREIMMAGTTLDVIAVTQIEKNKVGNGNPGPVAMRLRELILSDQL
jgi:branched-chain amino acid aminotransferase